MVCTLGLTANHVFGFGESKGLRIHTVDKNNNPFKVETVRWWPAGNVQTVHQLECNNGPCSEWILDEDVEGSIELYAAISNVTKADPECWEVYTGYLVVDLPVRDATIIITYANKACKSQSTSRS